MTRVRKDRYEVGDIVALYPEPASPTGGPHRDDFDMPVPFVIVVGVDVHVHNHSWVLGYTVREVGDQPWDSQPYEIKPGKISRLLIDAALIRRVKRAAAREHAIKDPYEELLFNDDVMDVESARLEEARWRIERSRRHRLEQRSRTMLKMPACRPWAQVRVEIVREESNADYFGSVEVTYGLDGPARAIYGVTRDGHVHCWAD